MPRLTTITILCCALVTAYTSRGAVVTISAAKDTTLYQPPSGGTTNSNGAGEHLFAGTTDDGYFRRGLIAFNITNFVPAGSTVTGVTLTLNLSRTRDRSEDVALHRVLANWGEGTSNAGQEEGRGTPAVLGDATWYHRFYPTSFWSTVGGDFRSTASATTTVSDREGPFSWSSPGLVADVQLWLNNPATNFGWLIKGGEGVNKTTKRFDTREVADASQRPTLKIEFISVAAVGACCMPDGSCQTVSSNQCRTLGGAYQGDGTSCTPNPCPQPPPVGACCMNDGTCEVTTLTNCVALGGTFQGVGTTCTSNLCPIVLTPFVDALPRPGVAQPVTGVPGGQAHYELAITEFKQKLHRDLPLTTVWGFAGSYPGPTIEASREVPLTVAWINNLRDTNGTLRTNHYLPVDLCLDGPDVHGAKPRTVTHLHGGHVTPENDGYPENTILPGQRMTNYYPNLQPPATIWYHDHALGITRLNVYMGLAGFYLIRDAAETALGLPAGEYEIPLAIQDRLFNTDGSLRYPATWEEHFFGDKVLVNGKVWPFVNVKRGKYRFRLLNGSQARTYTLAFSSGATFHQIGTDGGMLPAPVPLTQLTLAPGERADIIADFASYSPGTEVLLTNSAPAPFPGTPGVGVVANVMKFIVGSTMGHTGALPGILRPIERLQETNSVKSREFVLRKTSEPCAGSQWLINDLHWHDITEFPVLGTTEIWSFMNRSGVMHPMHMHLVLFQALDRQPFVFTNNMILPTGPPVAVPPNESGWKDTVRVGPNEIVRVIARFEDFTGRYPYHCHILEHEDHEMMRQFEVVLPPVITDITRSGADVRLTFRTTSNRLHFIERKDDFGIGTWINFTSGIPGSGGTTNVTDTGGASQSKRFYRIGLSP